MTSSARSSTFRDEAQSSEGHEDSHDNHPIGSSMSTDAHSSTSSHERNMELEYRVLQPGDFRRVKSHLILRPQSISGASLLESPRLSRFAQPLPVEQSSALKHAEFDPRTSLTESPAGPEGRASKGRSTFGASEIQPCPSARLAYLTTEGKEEIESLCDDACDPDLDIEMAASKHLACPARQSIEPLSHSQLSELKREASEVWSQRTKGTDRSCCVVEDQCCDRSEPIQPQNIPRRVTSLQRSDLVLAAMPKDGPSHSGRATSSFGSVSAPSTALRYCFKESGLALNTPTDLTSSTRLLALESLYSLRRDSTPMQQTERYSSTILQRPYTASVLSSMSDHSFQSYQNSFESATSPLLLPRSASFRPDSAVSAQQYARPRKLMSRPSTTSNIRTLQRNLSASPSRPETRNEMSPEEKRQQIKRTKKLVQVLGEEMLAKDVSPQTWSVGHGFETKHKKRRPLSFSSTTEPNLLGLASEAIVNSEGKAHVLSRKLRPHRLQTMKVSDETPSAVPIQGISFKAASILGIPHPYVNNVSAPPTCTRMSSDPIDGLSTSRPFIHSGLEELNEPTPKVSQLAAFTAAALDEGSSPTLPEDGPFQIERELAISEARRMAAVKEERRRRVLKMSRWLGEAVPADLITPGTSRPAKAANDSPRHLPSELEEASIDSQCSQRTCRSIQITSSQSYDPHSSAPQSIASPLHSFMSIDSSDSEGEDIQPSRTKGRQEAFAASVDSISKGRSYLQDSLAAYRNSIDSFDYLLRTDKSRLVELASILDDGCGSSTGMTRSNDESSYHRCHSDSRSFEPQSQVSSSHRDAFRPGVTHPRQRPGHRSGSYPATAEDQPRRSAAFLDLSESDSDSSDLDEEHDDLSVTDPIDSLYTLRSRIGSSASDRSISKLSNFFGSTPSQIVRSQSQHKSSSSPSSFQAVTTQPSVYPNNYYARGQTSYSPNTLKTILRSLEEEALEDCHLNPMQKSEISRKIHSLKKRSAKMFS